MAGIHATTEVHLRDNFGAFIAACDAAATRSVQEAMVEGTRVARAMAPSGPARQDYGRRPKLKANIWGHMISSRSARIVATPGHALPQEKSAGPHPIPNAFGRGITVQHPGNAAQPYLRPALAAIARMLPPVMKRNYPG